MSSFEKSRTKKMMMKRETAKKKRAKKKKTRATQSDHRVRPVVRLSFLLREHRHNKSRQAQTLERGASRSAAVIRHNDQFKCGDIREFNLVFLDFAYRVRGAEIPLLAHDVSKRASALACALFRFPQRLARYAQAFAADRRLAGWFECRDRPHASPAFLLRPVQTRPDNPFLPM